jgi:hypothetical protein
MEIQLHSYQLLMNTVYQRVSSGIYYDSELKLYSNEFLTKVLNYFESKEDYEKCSILRDLISTRFNHELNFKNHEIR